MENSVGGQINRVFLGGIDNRTIRAPRNILIVVDGNWLFASLTEYLRTLSLFDPSGSWPIVVGIGYPTDNDQEILARRNADLSLTSSTRGAQSLSQFIASSIFPMIENDIGINIGKKFLAGHSWGGSFALYNLFNNGSLYDGYIASSPVITSTPLQQMLDNFDADTLNKNTSLFYSHGSLEKDQFPQIVESTRILTHSLEKNNSNNLRYAHSVFDGETHSSVTSAALSKAVRFLVSN